MESLYSVMQGLESRLGGGEGIEGIYGSITATGMHKVLECMKHNCGLGRNSTLIDIGAGLGRPLLHALMLHGVAHGYGVELDRVKVAKAEAFCKGVIDELALRGVLSSSSGSRAAPAAAGAAAVGTEAVVLIGADTAATAAAAKGGGVAIQGTCMGSQEASSNPTPAAAAAAGEGDDVSDDTQVQFDSSQAGQAASETAPAAVVRKKQQGAENDKQPSAAGEGRGGGIGKLTQSAGAGGKVKVKGQPLVWPASRPIITCAAIEQIASLNPGTHAYSFWEGVPHSGKKAFGRLFRTSTTMKAVAVVQRAMRGQTPEAVMAELGFGPLMLIKAFPVSMSGSGRSFQAYVFSKVAPSAALLLMRHATSPVQQQHRQVGTVEQLASCTKPQRGSRLVSSDSEQAMPAAAAADALDGDDSPDQHQQQQQQLIPLLTEQSIADMQQQQGYSPAKRGQPFLPAAAAAAAQADATDGTDGSPSKKQKGTAAADDDLARGASGLYGLRPRQLSSSFGSGGSSRTASAATTAMGLTSTQRTGSSVRRTGLRSTSSSLSRGASAASMSVDQPLVGSNGGRRDSCRGTRSTAVSGGGSSRGEGKATKQQQQKQGEEKVGKEGTAAGVGRCGSSRRVQRNGGSAASAAVSEARAAVAALEVDV